MTLLNKIQSNKSEEKKHDSTDGKLNDQSSIPMPQVVSQFNDILSQFRLNNGFSVNSSEPPVDTMVEILSSKSVMVSITLLLSYIRYCINNGVKKDITIKIGHNKPSTCPMNFAVNEEMLEDIYPGESIEIN